MTDDLRQSAAEWAERTAIEQGLPPRVTDIATLRHVARLLGLLEPDGGPSQSTLAQVSLPSSPAFGTAPILGTI
jgi:hypothetical protein